MTNEKKERNMPLVPLTDRERAAFDREVTRGLSLGYFYTFDNVPLHFVYHDRVIDGELSDEEKRNKLVAETLWPMAYNTYACCHLGWRYLQQGDCLHLPLQAHAYGVTLFDPQTVDPARPYVPIELVQDRFNKWLDENGQVILDKLRPRVPVRGYEWEIQLQAPDRTMRLACCIPFGNRVVAEVLVDWSENGVDKQTCFASCLHFDVDGTILTDRSYTDLINWPGSTDRLENYTRKAQQKGSLYPMFNQLKDRKKPGILLELEKRNKRIVEDAWLKDYNDALEFSVFHPERFRMQFPLQKSSYKLKTYKEIEGKVKAAVPDRKIEIVLTYAKGNQVAAECIMSWTEGGSRHHQLIDLSFQLQVSLSVKKQGC
ncbi:MAG: hypothetical protein NTZ34_07075 [Chloroflexi bacterium]|nr:hypothetical protein [Chloroflexota bacterium]